MPVPPTPKAARSVESPSAVEEALDLTEADWRRIQQSLRSMGHDPGDVGGAPGVGTGFAIAFWQAATGHDASGCVDAEQVLQLSSQARPGSDTSPVLASADSVTGRWSGSVRYAEDTKPPFSSEADLRQTRNRIGGRITEPNTYSSGSASELPANLTGRMEDNRSVSFIKTYDGTGGVAHSVEYKGRLLDGKPIEGRWSTRGATGTFTMIRQ